MAAVTLAVGCGSESGQPGQAQLTPTPTIFGSATLSANACNFAMPGQLPLQVVRFKLVNQTQFTGRFILSNIHDGHTFQELLDYWNGPLGQVQAPTFGSELKSIDVQAGKTDVMTASISLAGTYAFHCGYFSPDAGKVIGFFHELKAG
ncbi:MAG TPA: hypothetical protein VLK30_04715 [Candidatus Limnocylindrales bacterium]|nr:hypothetical protein [Candidatus Limnocylindrales bacterium]